jgi:hypothetical protein
MSRDTDRILAQLATSALEGVIEGFQETAALYGGDWKLSLDDLIEVLQAVVDSGVTSPGRHLHSVKV